MLLDFRYALRVLMKSPGFTGSAILAIALGIGINSAVFSAVNAVLLRPLPFREPHRLALVGEKIIPSWKDFISLTPADYLDIRDRTHSFEQLGAYISGNYTLTGWGEPRRLNGARITANMLPILGVAAREGRVFLAAEDRPGNDVAILTDRGWKDLFNAAPNLLGKKITIDGEIRTVVGIMPPTFEFPENDTKLLLPMAYTQTEIAARGERYDTTVLGRLQPGQTIAQATAEIDSIIRSLVDRYPPSMREQLDLHARASSYSEDRVHEVRPALLFLLGAVGLVLLIGCVNVANLLLAKAAARQREIAIRAALGAGRMRIIRQLLIESLTLSLAGGALGLLFSIWFTRMLIAMNASAIHGFEKAAIDATVFFYTLGLSVVTGIVFGLAPAIHQIHLDLNTGLKETGRGVSHRSRMLPLLVVGEVALSAMLLIGAGLLLRSFAALAGSDPVPRPERLLTFGISLPEAKYPTQGGILTFYQGLVTRLESLPGVESASASTSMPLIGYWPVLFAPESRAPDSGQPAQGLNAAVLPGYFRTVGIALKKGRLLRDSDTAENSTIVINEKMAGRYWPGEDVVGKRLKWGHPKYPGPWLTIVGVVADTKQARMDRDIQPAMYMPLAELSPKMMGTFGRALTIQVRTKVPAASVAGDVRRTVASVDSELPVVELRSMDSVIAASFAPRRFNLVLIGVFASFAVLLAAIGLYGVMSYSVVRQTREIGIRMALGAPSAKVLREVIARGMLLVVAGLAIGAAAAIGLRQFVSKMIYGVSATDLVVFIAAPAFLAAIGLLACYIPARRAAVIDPLIALRSE